jgi:hypothetical protein
MSLIPLLGGARGGREIVKSQDKRLKKFGMNLK